MANGHPIAVRVTAPGIFLNINSLNPLAIKPNIYNNPLRYFNHNH